VVPNQVKQPAKENLLKAAAPENLPGAVAAWGEADTAGSPEAVGLHRADREDLPEDWAGKEDSRWAVPVDWAEPEG
jgi:hypothetical protein